MAVQLGRLDRRQRVALNGPEFDGWITATSDSESLKLGWTVLPKKAADVSASSTLKLQSGAGSLKLKNGSSVADGPTEIFALTGTSPGLPDPAPGEPGSPGSNAAIIDLAAVGVREPSAGIRSSESPRTIRRTVLTYPAEFDVYIDSNNDGTTTTSSTTRRWVDSQ